MSGIVDLHLHAPLHDPVLVVTLEGWIDAGAAATAAMRHILDSSDHELVASFDTDALLDHRARRPVMRLVDGVMEHLAWPSIEMRALTDTAGRHVLVLVGAEPDHSWRAFTSTVTDLAVDLGVTRVIGLGAYPAPVPHTRDTHLALTSPTAALIDAASGFVRGSVEVPAGVQAAIEMAATEAGLTAVGLWAQVPHYLGGVAYPAASAALLEGLTRVGGPTFDLGELPSLTAETRRQLDELVAGNERHATMISQLEEMYDSTDLGKGFGPLPTGDELAAELQAYLRDQGGER